MPESSPFSNFQSSVQGKNSRKAKIKTREKLVAGSQHYLEAAIHLPDKFRTLNIGKQLKDERGAKGRQNVCSIPKAFP